MSAKLAFLTKNRYNLEQRQLYNIERLIFFYITLILFLFVIIIRPSAGADLRDIRIGEYKSFTRIVFEFNKEFSLKLPVNTDENKVIISFSQTRKALKRNILFNKSGPVMGIEFFQKQSHLTAVIILEWPYFRIKSFPLSNPARYVIDIYKIKSQDIISSLLVSPLKAKAILPISQLNIVPNKDKPLADKDKHPGKKIAKRSDISLPVELIYSPFKKVSDSEQMPINFKTAFTVENLSPKQDLSQTKVKEPVGNIDSLQHDSEKEKTGLQDNLKSVIQKNAYYGNIQYYLIIILIIITIIIIVLLCIIIIHKGTSPKNRRTAEPVDPLNSAIQKIAMLDEKIKKQLNKYDEVK